MPDRDDPIERRRAARRQQFLLLAAVLGSLAVTVGLFAVVAVIAVSRNRQQRDAEGKAAVVPVNLPPAVPAVPADGPPASWTHAELAAYLRQKGVPVRVEGGGMSAIPNTILSVLVDEQTGQRVKCYLAQSEPQAKEAAASLGNRATSWGRFVLADREGDNDTFYRRVAAALR